MRCFVLGNGKSRLAIQPPDLKAYGKIYGCNALYREFDPDFLIAVDPKMVMELNSVGYQHKHSVWTNGNARYKAFRGFNYFIPSLGWSSGPTALDMASRSGVNEIYILGFDYEGENGKLNNVYANTKNYKLSSDVATYYGNWMRQTEKVIRDNKHIKYYRLVGDKYFDTNWHFSNFKNLNYTEFKQLLKTWPKN
jgi:hypothetical protein